MGEDLLLTSVANQESHQDLCVMRKITGSIRLHQLRTVELSDQGCALISVPRMDSKHRCQRSETSAELTMA